ncbi:hypothetical protein HYV69_02800 [Candidatus Uhrbacteria bacterium]|nr:hypothetical protein [Candidatus Uhrbacteria bacterium]
MPTKKKKSGGFTRSIIYILSLVIVVLIVVIFVRDQSNSDIDKEVSNIKQKNNELEVALADEQIIPIAQRLGTAGIDTLNLWKFETEGCEIPYCLSTRIGVDGVEDFAEQTRGLSRWKGYVSELKEVKEAGEVEEAEVIICEAFAIDGGADFPINTDLLADVEKKLLKAANEKNQIEITVYSIVTGGEPISCKTPAYVLNVHL